MWTKQRETKYQWIQTIKLDIFEFIIEITQKSFHFYFPLWNALLCVTNECNFAIRNSIFYNIEEWTFLNFLEISSYTSAILWLALN